MFAVQATPGTVLCCLCGLAIPPNPANMCANCIRSQVDITEGVQKQCTVLWCKECNRWLQPPKNWMRAELESKELLTFCVKKVKGLNKVKLIDAGFIWTEPHSRRLKLKLTIQKEVMNGAILQQTFVVDFVVEPHMCDQCQRSNTNSEVWIACVQVRQKVEHKRTFLFLEQLMLKHGADVNTVGIKEAPDGLDFFYASRSHALKLCDFLQSVVAVSADHNSNTYNYKHTFSTEIVPICKEDLVCLPHKVYSALGGLGPFMLCTRVSNILTLVCPATLRKLQVDATAYYRAPYKALLSSRQLTEFIVLDIELIGEPTGEKAQLAEAQVARVQDFGKNDTVIFCKTHLGSVLKAGDLAWGYDVAGANMVDPEIDKYKNLEVPDVVLVRKSYSEKRRARKERGKVERNWTLKRMAVEAGEAQARADAEERRRQEEEAFMQELEEDPELRSRVAIYRDPTKPAPARRGGAAAGGAGAGAGGDDSDGDYPEIPLEELLEDLRIGGAGADDDEEMDEG